MSGHVHFHGESMKINEIKTLNDLSKVLNIEKGTLTYVLYGKHVDYF